MIGGEEHMSSAGHEHDGDDATTRNGEGGQGSGARRTDGHEGRDRTQPPGVSGTDEGTERLEKLKADLEAARGFFEDSPTAAALEELKAIHNKKKEDLTKEDKDRMAELVAQVGHYMDDNPDAREYAREGLKNVFGEQWIEDKFPEPDPDVPEETVDPENPVEEPGEITDDAARELQEASEALKKDLDEYIKNPDGDPDGAKWNKLQERVRQINLMGDPETNKKIANSKRKAVRAAYGAYMGFLVTFWLALWLTSVIARGAGGKGKS